LVGASALPPSVRTNFADHTGLQLLEGYGLTEATCASVRSFTDNPRPGSVGQRMPYQHVKAVRVDDDGTWHDLPAGEVGHLVISGPTVFPGYVVGRDGDALRLDGLGALHDGWLDTGDLAAVDADGFVHLRGRAKDLIIRGGHNIDPKVIEDALGAHPAVQLCAAVGAPDPYAGELPVAFAQLRPGAAATEAELLAFTAARVDEAPARPRGVTIVERMPMTNVGKVYKPELRALAAAAVARTLVDAVCREHGVAPPAIEPQAERVTLSLPVDFDAATEAALRVALEALPFPFDLRRHA
jgi:fatty-acyl-CoA synthase